MNQPDWITQLIAATEAWCAEVGAMRADKPSELLTSWQIEWTRFADHEQPDRICAWCHHPRNSPECQFAANHTPYPEVFA